MKIEAFLRRIVAALKQAGVPYMLTGSLASFMYGVPRATNDVDVVIAPEREELLDLVGIFERGGLLVAWEA